MVHLTAHHLRFSLEVGSTIELNEHKGSALRGLLFNALRGPDQNPALGFCTQRHLKSCAECVLVAVCPVAGLVATLDPEAERGRDVPRPYAIKPPLDDRQRYEAGDALTFGLTLFGDALNLFPYVVMGLRQAERGGLGKKLPRPAAGGRFQRGLFKLRSAQAINLLSGEVQDILQAGSSLVQRPDMPVTHDQVLELSRQMLSERIGASANGFHSVGSQLYAVKPDAVEISLVFKTPTRIVEREHLLKEPQFRPILQRLLERLEALSGEGMRKAEGGRWRAEEQGGRGAGGQRSVNGGDVELATWDKVGLLALGEQVELVENRTRWADVWSYSSRRGDKTPIGGLVGQAVYRAEAEVWAVLLPYLLWGSVVHVGKSAVKGDGWFGVAVAGKQGVGSKK